MSRSKAFVISEIGSDRSWVVLADHAEEAHRTIEECIPGVADTVADPLPDYANHPRVFDLRKFLDSEYRSWGQSTGAMK